MHSEAEVACVVQGKARTGHLRDLLTKTVHIASEIAGLNVCMVDSVC